MCSFITGAGGFLGKQILRLLDRKYNGYALTRSRPVSAQNFHQVKGNILRPHIFTKKLNDIDTVIHLAAINKATSDAEYERLFETNTIGTLNMLELARKKGAKRFIFASSAAVYGDKKTLPLKETFSPNPKSAYGLSKLIGEQICKYYSLTYALPTICLRISNMYGPDQQLNFVVSDLIYKSIKHEVIEVENPTSTRDFIYVDDVAEATIRCLSARTKKFEVINIGSGKEANIRKIAQLVGKFSGKKIIFKKNNRYNVKRSMLDINKARETLNWKPKVSLEKGLKDTWEQMIKICGD